MPFSPSSILPRILPRAGKGASAGMRVARELQESARAGAAEALERLATSAAGLTAEEAERRLEEYGANTVVEEHRQGWTKLLLMAVVNPLVILLAALAVIAYVTEDMRTAVVITAMVLLGVILRFIQEYRADNAAARLKAMIRITTAVMRDGKAVEIPMEEVVPGDIIQLAAGDMIPADVRLLACKDLFVIQSALTGESMPVEKFDALNGAPEQSPLEYRNLCFLGTSVESGSATALAVTTGRKTFLGGMANALTEPAPETAFDRGIRGFTWLMIRFILVLVPVVFLINLFTKGEWHEAFFFAMAVAVGMTPEMLPMIVTVSLSKGSMLMSRHKVIIKRLNAIQNLGAMDVLCTDKTGTLTVDHVILEQYCDVVREPDDTVLQLAFLNSHFQTGLKNVLDRAILDHTETLREARIPEYRKVDEVPFDFSRKIMSVVVETPEGAHRIIAKGAPEEIFRRCTHFQLEEEVNALEPILLEDLKEEYQRLSADGFRVLAIAYKDLEKKSAYAKDDETGMILKGYLAFLDPPKETAAPAISALHQHGIGVKVLTGDNELVTRKICSEVGLPVESMLLGGEVERMSDAELAEAAESATVFARLSPAHKQRIVKALQGKGHVVGFMGDGINDGPALRAADVGISVDSAVDIAKEAADAILLEKSLMVLEEGVIEGRKVFANIMKYIRMGASSNFGNMFSVLGASIFLPFLPMLPIQILTNNLLYDFSQTPIPTDEVDPEQIARPRPWSIGALTRFILLIGPVSSIFDYATFFLMFYFFQCADPSRASLFQTGWFVESLMTQTLIIHVIRTNRLPFLQSRASWPLLFMSAAVLTAGLWLPFSPLSHALGFSHLPDLYWPFLLAMLAGYITLTQVVKSFLLRKGWIS